MVLRVVRSERDLVERELVHLSRQQVERRAVEDARRSAVQALVVRKQREIDNLRARLAALDEMAAGDE